MGVVKFCLWIWRGILLIIVALSLIFSLYFGCFCYKTIFGALKTLVEFGVSWAHRVVVVGTQCVRWLYGMSSELDFWSHSESTISYQHVPDLQLLVLPGYGTLKSESIRTGGQENTCNLVQDVVQFTSNSVSIRVCLQQVSKMAAFGKDTQSEPSSAPTEIGGCLNMLVVQQTACVERGMPSENVGSLFSKTLL